MLASSTCAVQMLDVAFSRRMCCSRVCSARRSAGPPVGVGADADEAARHERGRALVGGDERGVRTAEPHRHAEALGRTDGDVGAELAGRDGQHARQQVGGDDGDPAEVVDLRRWRRASRRTRPGRRRQAEQRAEAAVAAIDGVDVADDELDADRLGPGAQHGDRLRVGVVVDDEAVRRRLRQTPGHRHRLGGGGRLVEQRGVGDVEPGELGDHRLEVEQRLEAALADLGLVRRVRRVPGRVLEHVALDHRRA